MKETKVYVVKHPEGAYEDYQEPIVKVFFNEKAAKSYVKEENAKLPLEQAKKCDECYFKWTCLGQKGKEIPSCYNGDKYNCCENYFKYCDIQELFIEEHKIDDIKTHDRELVKEVCEKIKEKTFGLWYFVLNEQKEHFEGNRYVLSQKDFNDILDQLQKEFEDGE